MDKVYTGLVVWFSNQLGIGFITWRNDEGIPQKDMFVHYSDVCAEPGTFKTLKKDQRVSFEIGQNNKGQPKAINVLALDVH